jgi:hypothetical protein
MDIESFLKTLDHNGLAKLTSKIADERSQRRVKIITDKVESALGHFREQFLIRPRSKVSYKNIEDVENDKPSEEATDLEVMYKPTNYRFDLSINRLDRPKYYVAVFGTTNTFMIDADTDLRQEVNNILTKRWTTHFDVFFDKLDQKVILNVILKILANALIYFKPTISEEPFRTSESLIEELKQLDLTEKQKFMTAIGARSHLEKYTRQLEEKLWQPGDSIRILTYCMSDSPELDNICNLLCIINRGKPIDLHVFRTETLLRVGVLNVFSTERIIDQCHLIHDALCDKPQFRECFPPTWNQRQCYNFMKLLIENSLPNMPRFPTEDPKVSLLREELSKLSS